MRTEWARFLLWAVGCAVAADAVLAGIPIVFGVPHPIIRITWRDVSPATRVELERQFRLADPIAIDDSDWGYVPQDTSAANLRAIATNPSVANAEGIDARAWKLVRSPPLSPRRGGLIAEPARWMAQAARLLAYGLEFATVFMLFRAALAGSLIPARWGIRRAIDALRLDPVETTRRLPALSRIWMQRGVPLASPAAAGLFRVVFGICVVAFVLTEPIDPNALQSFEASVAQGPHGVVVQWLGAHPAVTQNLNHWLLISGALFVAGFGTPITFACFVAGFLLWASVFTLTASIHPVGALGLTLICLLAARWNDAWSIDAWLQRLSGRPRPIVSGQRYGFAIWVPRLVLGVAFLAAAWSKIGGGPAWVLNGTVKYYFVADLDHALVAWGPALTQHHWIAVVMSGFAVLVEVLLVTAAFSRSDRYALLLGVSSLALLAGMGAFQGVMWYGWWLQLLAFLPWHRVTWTQYRWSPDRAERTSPFSLAQVVVVAMLVTQQVVMSAFQLEARPLLSSYDMYSATYASPEEFEEGINLVYRVRVLQDGQRHDVPECVVDERTAELMRAVAASRASDMDRLRSLLGPCLEAERSASEVTLEGDRRVYDWNTRRFEWQRAIDTVGPVPAQLFRQ